MKPATVIVSASMFEWNPDVVVEVMTPGVPVVAPHIPPHPKLLDRPSARLVTPGAVGAAGIQDSLRGPAAATTRAQVARARAERYALSAIAQRYGDAYAAPFSARSA